MVLNRIEFVLVSIIHIVQRMAPGGIETLVLDLALSNTHTYIISLEGKKDALIADWPNLAALGNRLMAFDKREGLVFSLVYKIFGCLRSLKATAVVMHHIGPLVYGGLASRLAGIKIRVHVEHDGWHYAHPRRRQVGRLLDYLVDPRKVAVSHATAKLVSDALNSDFIEIIPNGVDMKCFKPADRLDARKVFKLPQDACLIGTVGRLVHVKGHDVLIKAMSLLPENIHLVLVGDGVERAALQALGKEYGVSRRLHFLGHCNETQAIYPAFDVFCLPSRAEGFPRTLIEAQACNIPVIATDVGGSKEAVCPQTGLLVAPENAQMLADSLKTLIGQAVFLSPRSFVNSKFSFERSIDAYDQITESSQTS